MLERPQTASIPDAPGSYQFLDADGRVLYVGKAKSLRSRLNSYFADPATLAPRTAQMLSSAHSVQWTQVASEVDAVMLECSLIKEHRPRYNVRLVDDKSYPWVALTVRDEWPRVAVVRGRRRSGVRYFGPYSQASAIRDTVDLLVRCFPLRTCSDSKLERHRRLGSPCLLAHIERCAAPCVGAVAPERYAGLVENFAAFLGGETEAVVARIREEMREAAGSLEFERAARLRDQLESVSQAMERQQVVSDRHDDIDVIGVAEDELLASVAVLHIRHGRIVGRRGMLVEKEEDIDAAGLVAKAIEELYASSPRARLGVGRRPAGRPATDSWVSGSGNPAAGRSAPPRELDVPRRVVVCAMPEEEDLYRELLRARRGGPVDLVVPLRGAGRKMLELTTINAREDLARQRLRRSADHDSRSRALHALQEHLGLDRAPLRIECYDMSHLQGSDYVGSMVVFEDGLARPSEYRRFKVRGVPGNDDYAAMEEVLTRRLTAFLDARAAQGDTPGSDGAARDGAVRDGAVRDGAARDGAPAAEGGPVPARRRSFAYPPQLLLLDGGKGQLGVGVRVLERLGLTEEIPVASLAKTFEEVFVPGRSEPVRVPRGSEALFLLQQARDEAHRFAISYHRTLRSKRLRASELDGVVGLGAKRKARLLRELGSVARLEETSLDDLLAIGWLPEAVARALYAKLHPGSVTAGQPSRPAVDEDAAATDEDTSGMDEDTPGMDEDTSGMDEDVGP